MASYEHLQLSQEIKELHKTLREHSKDLGLEEAWKRHCENKEILTKYAHSMQQLATKHWEVNYSSNSKAKSRIKWIYDFCNFYFYEGEILRQRDREIQIFQKVYSDIKANNLNEAVKSVLIFMDGITSDLPQKAEIDERINPYNCCSSNNILKLLDVGSCYNPFSTFECFDVTAIDIAPANSSVKFCDFLNVSIVENVTETYDSHIKQLQECSFHAVIFSLLLEYLPSPEQRFLCCLNAYKVLKYEGLLLIITPDSKHVGTNAKIMKSWRYVLAQMGFSRIKYEKLPHIHCMAFRKSINPKIAARWSQLQKSEDFYDKIHIPQDFSINEEKSNNSQTTDHCNVLFFEELPMYDS